MGMSDRAKVLFVVGPTAVGKTETAIYLAQRVGGEIISADSRQVYRRMDIGTAKPTSMEQSKVQHHLVDIVDPDQELSLAEFQSRALDAISDVAHRGRLPMVVGGTGQYVRAVLEGWTIPEIPPQSRLRLDLATFSGIYSESVLHAHLAVVDQDAAQRIHYHNVRRVIRALEVYHVSGTPISTLQARTPPPFNSFILGLTRPRELLYQRADARIDAMIADGLMEETRELARQYGWGHSSMSSLGYPEIGAYLRGEISLLEAVAQLQHATRRFIRQQYNWFSTSDPKIKWFDLEVATLENVKETVQTWQMG